MAVEERVVWGFRCERCDHRWLPRLVVTEPPERLPEDALPTVCPSCKNTRWNTPKVSPGGSLDPHPYERQLHQAAANGNLDSARNALEGIASSVMPSVMSNVIIDVARTNPHFADACVDMIPDVLATKFFPKNCPNYATWRANKPREHDAVMDEIKRAAPLGNELFWRSVTSAMLKAQAP